MNNGISFKEQILDELDTRCTDYQTVEWKFGNTGGIVSTQTFREMVAGSTELFAEKVLWRIV